MPKFYAQCGPEGKLIISADDKQNACLILLEKVISEGEGAELSPFTVVSEAGFNEDIVRWGNEKMSDDQFIYSTSSLLRFMGLEEIADDMDRWCVEQNNPILMHMLAQVRDNEEA